MSINADMPIWSSDAPISMPVPSDDPVRIQMYGFGMTQYGIVHDLTGSEYEQLRSPTYAPELPPLDSVYDDEEG